MTSSAQGTNRLRGISTLFTPSTFRRVLGPNGCNNTLLRINKHNDIKKNRSINSVLAGFYHQLESGYRNEYIFKNALLNQELLSKHCLSNTTVLNEFRIGTSIADFVLLNGEIRIFEIKTDLDNFEKLDKQIQDYRKFANRIYIVVSERNAELLTIDFRNSSIGIIGYTDENSLRTIKRARVDNSKLDHEVLFKTLRKPEYLGLIQKRFGAVPEAPNTRIIK